MVSESIANRTKLACQALLAYSVQRPLGKAAGVFSARNHHAVFGGPSSTLSEKCRNIRLTQTRNRVEAKVIPKLFVCGLRASGDEKKFGMKSEILKRPPMYNANADIDMIKTIPFT